MTMYKFPASAKLELVGVFEIGMVLRWWERRLHRHFLHECFSAPEI